MANEKRLIDANALGIGRCNPDLLPFGNRPYAAGWNGVVSIIDNAPTVDAVEVVRCKDCEHKYINKHGELCCEIWAHNRDTVVIDYDFCSYGRRKIHV